jgi:hypothetical protein
MVMAKKSKKDQNDLLALDTKDVVLGGEDGEESSVAAFTRRRGFSGAETRQFVKVELPENLTLPLEEGLVVLEERGLKRTSADFLKFCLESVSESQITQWVEQETPLEWRVSQCLKDAEKAKLVRRLFDLDSSKSPQILKALEQVFEKKEKGLRSLPKKKKKPSPAAHTESSPLRTESMGEASLT